MKFNYFTRILVCLMIIPLLLACIITAKETQEPSQPPKRPAATSKPANSILRPTNPPSDSSAIETEPQFSLGSANTTSPADVLIEVVYTTAGGGGDADFGYQPYESRATIYSRLIDDQLIVQFSNFKPNEKVRLLAYTDSDVDLDLARMFAWQNYQVDSDGKLQIICSQSVRDQYRNIFFVAVGTISGDAYEHPNGFHKSVLKAKNNCPGAPPQRADLYGMVHVCTKSDRLKVRQGPGKNYSETLRLDPGTSVMIVGGPVCADNWSWWEVRLPDHSTGWVAEGGDAIDPYFICPK